MQVDDTLLSKLEHLSYLKVSDDKRAEIIAQMDKMIAFVDNLSELDTGHIDGSFAMSDASTRLREDTPFCDVRINDDILNHAPRSEEHFFIVPKIIE